MEKILASTKVLLVVILHFFIPIQTQVLTILGLVLADLVTGLLAAYRSSTPITSSGLRKSLPKLFLYEIAMLLSYVIQTNLTGPGIPLVSLVSTFIGSAEMLSLTENLNTIKPGLFSGLLAKLNQ